MQETRSRNEDSNSGQVAAKHFLSTGASGKKLANHASLLGFWNLPLTRALSPEELSV